MWTSDGLRWTCLKSPKIDDIIGLTSGIRKQRIAGCGENGHLQEKKSENKEKDKKKKKNFL